MTVELATHIATHLFAAADRRATVRTIERLSHAAASRRKHHMFIVRKGWASLERAQIE